MFLSWIPYLCLLGKTKISVIYIPCINGVLYFGYRRGYESDARWPYIAIMFNQYYKAIIEPHEYEKCYNPPMSDPSFMEQDLLTLPEQLRSPLGFGGVRVAYSLVFYVVSCVLLFVCLSFFNF